jgi:hypothetical protein
MRIASNIIFPDYATDVTQGNSSDEAVVSLPADLQNLSSRS